MSANSSSSSNSLDFFLPASSTNHTLPVFMYCFLIKPSSYIFTAFVIVNILILLPLCILTMNIGLQQNCSTAAMRHSVFFMYNMVVMQQIGVVGSVVCCCGVYTNHFSMVNAGCLIFAFSWYGQAMSHILTSVESYLATVHPITYLGLKKEKGVRIRNVSIACNWLIAIVGMSLVTLDNLFVILDFVLLMLSFAVICFCSLSVLCVLIRPGPSELGGAKKQVDQLKQRAMFSIMIILGVLLFRFAWNLCWIVMLLSGNGGCLFLMLCTFSSLPSSLVLPLLFLRREGKLVFCNNGH